ncbi:MAG: hypothetical protein MJ137_09455 [Clostridia bacterium]|nr:hypothetical protein [Clostridia bacterium]
MIEKKIETGYLLDFYGSLLSARQREVIDMYYNDDMSLSEISSEIGISRQGVRDIIVKSSSLLGEYEEKLGMAGKFGKISELSAKYGRTAEETGNTDLQAFIKAVLDIVE